MSYVLDEAGHLELITNLYQLKGYLGGMVKAGQIPHYHAITIEEYLEGCCKQVDRMKFQGYVTYHGEEKDEKD